MNKKAVKLRKVSGWGMTVAGVILTGGMSRRFGSPKAFAMYGDRMFYERTIELVEPFVDNLLISTSRQLLPRWKDTKGLTSVELVVDDDRFSGNGPLAGIFSAMATVEAEQYLILPCDMPFMGSEMLEELVNKSATNSSDVLAFQCQKSKHPLVGLYRRSNFKQLALYLERGDRRVVNYLSTVETSWIQVNRENEKMFENINQLEDLQKTLVLEKSNSL